MGAGDTDKAAHWTRTAARPAAAGALVGASAMALVWGLVGRGPVPEAPDVSPPAVVEIAAAEDAAARTGGEVGPEAGAETGEPRAVVVGSAVPSSPLVYVEATPIVVPLAASDDSDEPGGEAAQAPGAKPASAPPARPATKPAGKPTGKPAPQPEPKPTPKPGEEVVPARLNVNRATLAELESLPGIGPTLAQRIVDDREANGAFRSIEDLKRVRGIGDKTAAKLEALIRFE